MKKSDLNYKSYEAKHDISKWKLPVLIILGLALIVFLVVTHPFTAYNPTGFMNKAEKRMDEFEDTKQDLEQKTNGIEGILQP